MKIGESPRNASAAQADAAPQTSPQRERSNSAPPDLFQRSRANSAPAALNPMPSPPIAASVPRAVAVPVAQVIQTESAGPAGRDRLLSQIRRLEQELQSHRQTRNHAAIKLVGALGFSIALGFAGFGIGGLVASGILSFYMVKQAMTLLNTHRLITLEASMLLNLQAQLADLPPAIENPA